MVPHPLMLLRLLVAVLRLVRLVLRMVAVTRRRQRALHVSHCLPSGGCPTRK